MQRASLFLLAVLLVAPPIVAAKPAAAPGKMISPPDRMISVLVFGADSCPKGSDDEIVVCARLPESERYRIPKRFRDKPDMTGAGQAWGSRVSSLEAASAAGRPNSCSPNGSNGFTGCYAQLLHQWNEDRRQRQSDASDVP